MQGIAKKDALVLAQKVIGVANMGFLASDRLVAEARNNMEKLQSAGACVAPDALRVLGALQTHVLPGQQLCQAAMNQIGQTLRPIQIEARAQRVAARQLSDESGDRRDRQTGG